MSKYLKPNRLIDTLTDNAQVVSTATTDPTRYPSRRSAEGYTESDLPLFDALMDFRQASAAPRSRPSASAQTYYTQQDSDHFARLTTAIASNDDSSSEKDVAVAADTPASGDQIKIRYFANP